MVDTFYISRYLDTIDNITDKNVFLSKGIKKCIIYNFFKKYRCKLFSIVVIF